MASLKTSQDTLADRAELYVSTEGILSKSDLSGLYTDLSQEEVDDVFAILSKRQIIYGDTIPYTIDHELITSKIDLMPDLLKEIYKFCLFMGTYGNGHESAKYGKLFERISKIAFQKYIGGESLIFGFPDGHTTSIKEKIDDLANYLKEERGHHTPDSNAKDCKLDIVVFKEIDGRPCKDITLIQSAAGKNRKSKVTELSVKQRDSYIRFSSSPRRGFSTSQLIDNERDFHDQGSRVDGLLFDRARIYKFCQDTNDDQLLNDLANANKVLLKTNSS